MRKKIEGTVATTTETSTEETLTKDSTKTTENASLTTRLKEEQHEGIKVNSLDFKNPLTDCGTKTTENRESNLWIFILGFIGGLIALLTRAFSQ